MFLKVANNKKKNNNKTRSFLWPSDFVAGKKKHRKDYPVVQYYALKRVMVKAHWAYWAYWAYWALGGRILDAS